MPLLHPAATGKGVGWPALSLPSIARDKRQMRCDVAWPALIRPLLGLEPCRDGDCGSRGRAKNRLVVSRPRLLKEKEVSCERPVSNTQGAGDERILVAYDIYARDNPARHVVNGLAASWARRYCRLTGPNAPLAPGLIVKLVV